MKKTTKTISYFMEKGVKILDEMPRGWKVNKGATTAPDGYVWIWNGKSLFSGEYQHALLKV